MGAASRWSGGRTGQNSPRLYALLAFLLRRWRANAGKSCPAILAVSRRKGRLDAMGFTIPPAWPCHAVPPLHKGGFFALRHTTNQGKDRNGCGEPPALVLLPGAGAQYGSGGTPPSAEKAPLREPFYSPLLCVGLGLNQGPYRVMVYHTRSRKAQQRIQPSASFACGGTPPRGCLSSPAQRGRR